MGVAVYTSHHAHFFFCAFLSSFVVGPHVRVCLFSNMVFIVRFLVGSVSSVPYGKLLHLFHVLYLEIGAAAVVTSVHCFFGGVLLRECLVGLVKRSLCVVWATTTARLLAS